MNGYVVVTQKDAQHVLWNFASGGYEPGSFTKGLMRALQSADPENRERVRLGFPSLVRAMEMAQHESDGIETLKAIANGVAK